MTAAASAVQRLDVVSADGTRLAVWSEGTGPPLVMVHGSLSDHTRFDPLVAELRGSFTTFAMDRRGFGASGDAADYDIEREFEDVAAVVEAVATSTGEPVALWGHSYGANCAMGGAARTAGVHHLVLYEPSLGLTFPAGALDAVERALADGDRERAIMLVFADVLEMDHDEVEAMKTSPLWPMRLATAPTVLRESRTEEGWVWQAGQFDGITAPTLMLAGSESPGPLAECTRRAAAAIPGARARNLSGHGHMAHITDPAMVARIIEEFVGA